MTERHVKMSDKHGGLQHPRWPIGSAFAYQSSIWRVQGLYLAATSSGNRELWWILDEQKPDVSDVDGGGE